MPTEPLERLSTEILVIGSGAGGATAAAALAEAGRSVMIVEEGPAIDTAGMSTHSPEAMLTLYRNAGLSPILGFPSIAFVEGRCVGGSTEINSAFWHRLPPEMAERWRVEHGLAELGAHAFAAAFRELEQSVGVSVSGARTLPPSSRVFKEGCDAIGTPASERPRAQAGDLTGSQFAPGAKRSMSRTFIPRAVRAGAALLADCRVLRLEHRGRRVTGAWAFRGGPRKRPVLIEAEAVFLCGGAIQTPALLRTSGIKRKVGDTLCIHPMLKVAAEFEETLDAHKAVLPFYQLRDPQTGVFLGGSVFTPGFLGLTLSERWPHNEEALRAWRRMGLYYAACAGSGRGSVRVLPGWREPVVRYSVSRQDRHHLRIGLLRLCDVLFAGGARRIYPGLRECPPLHSPEEARAILEGPIPSSRMSLSTVHVTSSCPVGADSTLAPADARGRLRGFENLFLADASALPGAPGVNPQATVMALSLHIARRFLAEAGA